MGSCSGHGADSSLLDLVRASGVTAALPLTLVGSPGALLLAALTRDGDLTSLESVLYADITAAILVSNYAADGVTAAAFASAVSVSIRVSEPADLPDTTVAGVLRAHVILAVELHWAYTDSSFSAEVRADAASRVAMLALDNALSAASDASTPDAVFTSTLVAVQVLIGGGSGSSVHIEYPFAAAV